MTEEDTMETEETHKNPETGETVSEIPESATKTEIINHLLSCEDVFFKSQQRGEEDLTPKEKAEIASKIWTQSKSGFLSRFGKHLKEEHLEYFQQFSADELDGYAIGYYLTDLKRFFTKSKREKDVRNRRYDALKKLVEESSYFGETEMMQRNPLLYHQLVGQYLSEEEKKKRDNIDTKNITFVNLLLESIDRDSLKKKQKEQKDLEECAMEEDEDEDEDADEEPSKQTIESDSWDDEPTDKTTKWGEFPGSSANSISFSQQTRRYDDFFKDEAPKEVVLISATERQILKEEFISIMYQNFLDGKDADFDYSSVDDNEAYDNLELKTHDAEDSYFDSETPEDVPVEQIAEEDELDVFMSRLNNHPTVQQLSEQMNNL